MRHGAVASIALGILLAATAPALAHRLDLHGRLVQGGLVRGTTEPGAVVELDGRRVRVSPEGIFLLGFSRDAAAQARLVVRFPDGKVTRRQLHIAKRTYKIERIDGLPEKMVTPPPEVTERIRRENAIIARLRQRDTPATLFLSGWIRPAKGRVTGVYGSQRILNGKPRRPHFGLDIAAPPGTPVVAPADGIVVLAERDLYYTGGTVILDHGHGLTSAFLHMRDVKVTPGRLVRRGEIIGTIGATGRVTGPHLDWRVNLFDVRLDPALLLRASGAD